MFHSHMITESLRVIKLLDKLEKLQLKYPRLK